MSVAFCFSTHLIRTHAESVSAASEAALQASLVFLLVKPRSRNHLRSDRATKPVETNLKWKARYLLHYSSTFSAALSPLILFIIFWQQNIDSPCKRHIIRPVIIVNCILLLQRNGTQVMRKVTLPLMLVGSSCSTLVQSFSAPSYSPSLIPLYRR